MRSNGHTTVPLVSVLVPAYRRLRFLPAALRSVASQAGLDYTAEVVVLSDSADAARAIRSVPFPPDVQVHLVQDEHQRIGEFIDAGLVACRGAYISFLDDDDEWTRTKFSHLTGLLRFNPSVDFVKDSSKIIDEAGRSPLSKFISSRLRSGPTSPTTKQIFSNYQFEGITRMYPYHPFHNESSMTIRTETLMNVRRHLRKVEAGLDGFLFFAGICGGGSLIITPDVLTMYRLHGTNVSSEGGSDFFARMDALHAYTTKVLRSQEVIRSMLNQLDSESASRMLAMLNFATRVLHELQNTGGNRRALLHLLREAPGDMMRDAPVELMRLSLLVTLATVWPSAARRAYLLGK